MTNGLRCLLCALLFFVGSVAQAADFSGKVIAVMDGDTLLVLRNGKPVKVRLAEMDAPEKAQPYGAASQKSLAEMVMGKQVRVASRAVDDYGRLIALVHVGAINVNYEQVRRGMAWEYSRFHNNRELMALQRDAQQAQLGLWANEAIEPSQWRKQHPGGSAPPRQLTIAPVTTPAGSACGSKKYCSEMTSCEEGQHHFAKCGIKTMDGDSDGVPCEKLCIQR